MQDIQLKQNFEAFLNDPGIQINHPLKENILLDDIFIFPDLRLGTQKVISSKELLDINKSGNKILISGSEDSGKTTLIKVLIKHYLKAGYYPLYIDTHSIQLMETEEILELIDQKFEELYHQESAEIIKAEPDDKKVIFIDNFDKISKDYNIYSNILKKVYHTFKNVILTEETPFNIINNVHLSISSEELARHIRHYEIMEFGHKLRSSLIQKWNKIGNSVQKGEETKNFIDAVIGHNLVPSYPIFLLMILQITHNEEADTVSGSSYGQYYEYMIIKSLSKSVEREKLDIYLDYLSNLSYHLFRKHNQAISPEEFSTFYKEQIINLPHLLTHTDIIEALIKADTITVEESFYRFKFKYIYYYFVARYLSKNMDSESVKEDIKSLCRDLHNDDYANIVLFLTHHTKDQQIINEILLTTESIFSEIDPFSLEEDSLEIDELIEELSTLGTKDKKLKELITEYSSRSIEKAIPQIVQGDDQFADESELITFHFAREEYSAANMALKIVGQILRSAKTQEEDKFSPLVRQSYLMALRSLNAHKKTLDLIKAIILNTYEERPESEVKIEDLSKEILIKEELYLSYKKIFIYYLRQTALSIGYPFTHDWKKDKQPGSLMACLLQAASMAGGKEPDLNITEIEGIIVKGRSNIFMTDLIRQTLSLYLYINAINSEDRENIGELIGNSKEWKLGRT